VMEAAMAAAGTGVPGVRIVRAGVAKVVARG
jgi:hypothetical protein